MLRNEFMYASDAELQRRRVSANQEYSESGASELGVFLAIAGVVSISG